MCTRTDNYRPRTPTECLCHRLRPQYKRDWTSAGCSYEQLWRLRATSCHEPVAGDYSRKYTSRKAGRPALSCQCIEIWYYADTCNGRLPRQRPTTPEEIFHEETASLCSETIWTGDRHRRHRRHVARLCLVTCDVTVLSPQASSTTRPYRVFASATFGFLV